MTARDGALSRQVTMLDTRQLNGTVFTSSVRARDFGSTLFLASANAAGGLTFTATVQDSANNVDFADVASPNTVTVANIARGRSILVDHQELREYLRLKLVTDGAASVSAWAVQLNNRQSRGDAPDLVIG